MGKFGFVCVFLFLFLVSLDAKRTQQDYVGCCLGVTAESVRDLDVDKQLYDVVMYYDNIYDTAAIGGTIDIWRPPYLFALDYNYWYQYVADTGPLGIFGPIGPLGPLSSLGPIGYNISNSSYSGSSASCTFCASLEKYIQQEWQNHPGISVLGPNGPLGNKGPLTGPEVYKKMYHLYEVLYDANNFPHNLDIFGVWGILGPLGPLGALGALGPLGILGPIPQLTNVTSEGSYIDPTNGDVIRTYTILFDGSTNTYREYPLQEFYTVEKALSFKENDCSFATEGSLEQNQLSLTFNFQSNLNQTLSAVVIPILSSPSSTTLSDFDLDLTISSSHSSPRSFTSHSRSSLSTDSASGYIDYIVARITSGENVQLTVSALASRLSSSANHFRLYVTGSGFKEGKQGRLEDVDLFDHQNIFGPHILGQN
mmetsp:Transcript_28897/g.44696  ORF Transcript_28897/g.44696 Transcript_28897/m.44696 type:complete len:424 (-) Transcript_28897:75-1346(-)